jgi:DNA-binding NarL/FixJ family response regulator
MRILLADSLPRVRFALRTLLEEQPGLLIVGEAAQCRSLLAQVEVTCPDLLLLSWELPGRPGKRLVRWVRGGGCPDLLVIVLSGRQAARQKALAAGADAFVSKIAPPERLLAAIGAAQRRQDAVLPLG